jgi:hypothetical protein
MALILTQFDLEPFTPGHFWLKLIFFFIFFRVQHRKQPCQYHARLA